MWNAPEICFRKWTNWVDDFEIIMLPIRIFLNVIGCHWRVWSQAYMTLFQTRDLKKQNPFSDRNTLWFGCRMIQIHKPLSVYHYVQSSCTLFFEFLLTNRVNYEHVRHLKKIITRIQTSKWDDKEDVVWLCFQHAIERCLAVAGVLLGVNGCQRQRQRRWQGQSRARGEQSFPCGK